MILEETKRNKIRIRAGQRATQYEKKRNATGKNILKECLKEKEREATKTKNIHERREYLMRNIYSQTGIDQLKERGKNIKGKRLGSAKTNPIQQNEKRKI